MSSVGVRSGQEKKKKFLAITYLSNLMGRKGGRGRERQVKVEGKGMSVEVEDRGLRQGQGREH